MLKQANSPTITLLAAVLFVAAVVALMPAHSMACGAATKASSMDKASSDESTSTAVPTMASDNSSEVIVINANATSSARCVSTATAQKANATSPACGASTATAQKANVTSSACGATKTTMQTANAPTCGVTSGTAQVVKADATTMNKTCTKEECIAKMTADGMTQVEAEAKYAACLAGDNCTGKSVKSATTLAGGSDKAVPTAQVPQ